ncbi:MAG: VanZ family protein [Gallionellaceae bacterium]|nr:VanZ family protein [Gallionellaceae bacterium]
MRYNRLFRFVCFASIVCILIGIFWLGAQPVAVGFFPEPIDKIAHSATFGLIAVLLWLAFLRGRPFIVLALVAIIGTADEVHQYFLPGRSASVADFTTDMIAAVTIVSLLEYTRRRTE